MEVKLLRLFGFEVNPYIKGEKRLRGFEEGNQSGKPFEEENENEKYLNIASSVMENTAKEKSSGHELEHKKYRCQFCQREFRNPQAMGGHQNAHKKEKVKKRRMQLQEKSNLSNSYCSPLQSQNNTVYHNSSPWPSSSDVAKFTCYEECLISFNHSCTNQIPDYGVPNVSKSISLAPQNCTPETSSRSFVIKPSPSHLSNNCQSLYIQLGLPQK